MNIQTELFETPILAKIQYASILNPKQLLSINIRKDATQQQIQLEIKRNRLIEVKRFILASVKDLHELFKMTDKLKDLFDPDIFLHIEKYTFQGQYKPALYLLKQYTTNLRDINTINHIINVLNWN